MDDSTSVPSSPIDKISLSKKLNQLGSDPFTGSHSIFDNIFRQFDDLNLSSDFTNRPLYVCPDGHIFLETFSQFYKPAYDFVISIAEPISRPKYIQEYQISTYSLYSAVSIGLTADEIIYVLSLFSKAELSEELKRLIKNTIEMIGKVKLILKNKRYFVQSTDIILLQYMAKKFDNYRVHERNEADTIDEETGFIIPDLEEEAKNSKFGIKSLLSSLEELGLDIDNEADDYFDEIVDTEIENGNNPFSPDDNNLSQITVKPPITKPPKSISNSIDTLYDIVQRFEIRGDKLREARKTALSLHIPFTDEYDFRSDDTNATLEIDLKKTTVIRSYQEKALSKMFGGSRAKSGIIVLPCGSGKTLVGITASCTIRKSTIVFCDSNISADQWYDQFKKYTNISPKNLYVFNSDTKINLPSDSSSACVLITTYSINVAGKSRIVQEATKKIYEREWGLMIMDEVQSLVAETISTVIDKINAHTKLGLTATLVREDDKIINLNYLVGPRLYEANWLDLSEQGFIARVKCFEILCKMNGIFYKEYLNVQTAEKQRILASLNPNKFNTVERLIRFHEARGDKILVFADILNVLEIYGSKLRNTNYGRKVRPVLSGSTPTEMRQKIFSEFKNSNNVNCIFISRIGDKAIDLPDANVLIQVCSHFGARMQEAQRLGRILRKKPGKVEEFNAFFYTVVSEDTREMFYSAKRRRFLTDQGYVFEIVQQCQEDFEKRWPISLRGGPLLLEDESSHEKLLSEILNDAKKTEEKKIENSDIEDESNDNDDNVISVRSFNTFGNFNTQFSNI